MATLQQMTTEYLEILLITNPGQASFPLTLSVAGLLTTPITRTQILNEFLNRIAADAQNPTSPATAYSGPAVVVQSFGTQVNSNGTLSNIGAVSPVVFANGAAGGVSATNTPGASMVDPVQAIQYVV
jgi:hypothetical protein